MTAVVTVKSQRKRISWHLKNRCSTKSRYNVNSSASKTCFVTRFSLIIQNRLHLLLKVLLNSKFIAKSTYRLTRSRNLESVSDRSRSLVFACFMFCFFFFFLHLGVSNFFADRSRSLGFVVLSFGFQVSNFSEFKDTTYRTERIN